MHDGIYVHKLDTIIYYTLATVYHETFKAENFCDFADFCTATKVFHIKLW